MLSLDLPHYAGLAKKLTNLVCKNLCDGTGATDRSISHGSIPIDISPTLDVREETGKYIPCNVFDINWFMSAIELLLSGERRVTKSNTRSFLNNTIASEHSCSFERLSS